ncbi:helix-turn-helix domain-containing protein [Lentzea sp. NPDC059081]|uniref:helix-turn-helix domain-containing protein n=1 Tax=Lentzea sp. NPDC059081 TaxID=3346719 RepID=UPI0036BB1027
MDEGRKSLTRFGARLRSARLQRGLSQKDLACPGVSMSYVSRLESGERVPSPAVVRRLAEVLDVDPSELTADEDRTAMQDEALGWCDALLAYHDGDFVTTVDLLEALGKRPDEEMFGWCVRWTRLVVLARQRDHEGLLSAAVKLRKSWSPGPAVDALVEILRASSLRRLGRTAESVRAANEAVALSTGDGDRVRRVHTRALISLCAELSAAGRLADAEQVVDRLSARLPELGRDRLAISTWWVRAKVADRLGDRTEAAHCIREAVLLLDDFDGDPEYRCRVRLAGASIGLRTPGANLCDVVALLDAVETTAAALHRPESLLAHVRALRAELALREGEVDKARDLAESAIATGLLDAEQQLRCHLLLVRAADEVDPDGGGEARTALAALLEHVNPEGVDPLLWRDVARVALRKH